MPARPAHRRPMPRAMMPVYAPPCLLPSRVPIVFIYLGHLFRMPRQMPPAAPIVPTDFFRLRLPSVRLYGPHVFRRRLFVSPAFYFRLRLAARLIEYTRGLHQSRDSLFRFLRAWLQTAAGRIWGTVRLSSTTSPSSEVARPRAAAFFESRAHASPSATAKRAATPQPSCEDGNLFGRVVVLDASPAASFRTDETPRSQFHLFGRLDCGVQFCTPGGVVHRFRMARFRNAAVFAGWKRFPAG